MSVLTINGRREVGGKPDNNLADPVDERKLWLFISTGVCESIVNECCTVQDSVCVHYYHNKFNKRLKSELQFRLGV